ncbi:ATP-binding protein [Actinokineospora enzanensis]|uniref:ATP-binding protein n=1 Tax=Actinokineospora enzanensis TaxID=155975 RepID=UPI000363D1F6|nr:ATP-binding protein [Actinokineospora enzanensis]
MTVHVPAVFSTTAPAHPDHLATLRHTLSRWLQARRIPRPLSADVVLAAHEAITDAINHPRHPHTPTTISLFLDADTLVLTADDHFSWTAPATDAPSARDARLRLISRVAERVDLSVDADRGSLTAYFPVGDGR